jgi:hypothetical protein
MKAYIYIPSCYLIFGLGWIFFSDLLLASVSGEPEQIIIAQIIKGCFFVLTSAVLIYFLARHAAKKLEEKERKRRQELQTLLGGVHHILLNYLNQMQLVSLEAERCEGFDQETVALARKLSAEASTELQKLSQLYLDEES